MDANLQFTVGFQVEGVATEGRPLSPACQNASRLLVSCDEQFFSSQVQAESTF